MGVQGLWHFLYSTGVDIDLSSLEGKVVAIDLSIWLNQALKSGIDSPNMHLEILFRRICKLLYYKIKPVFVFDGPSPSLKKETMILRRKRRQKQLEKSEKIRAVIINLLMKKKITNKRKYDNGTVKESVDVFKLPKNEYFDNLLKDNFEMDFGFSDMTTDYLNNFSSSSEVNIESEFFQSMPLEVQHEVVRNIAKEKRYGYDNTLDSYANKSGEDFSSLQIQKLLSRNALQQQVENLRASMNSRNNQSIMSSLKLQSHNKLSLDQIHTKKIVSRNEGYLMMIDPSENDLVDSLTKLKKEYLFCKKDEKKKSDTIYELLNENKAVSYKIAENYSFINEKVDEIQPINEIKIADECNPRIKYFSDDLNFEAAREDIQETEIFPVLEQSSETVNENIIFDLSGNTHCEIVLNEQSDSVISRTKHKTENLHEEYDKSVIDKKKYNPVPILEKFNNLKNLPESKTLIDKIYSKIEDQLDSVIHNEIKKLDDGETDDENENDFIDVPEVNITKDFINKYGFTDNEVETILTDPIKWHHDIEETISNLCREEHKIESQAVSMSEKYYEEAKELLKYFGIPYVESPGEAEAQCVFLEKSKLTFGTITEDSDIWLFGGCNVYKHVFSRGLSVRAYNNEQIYNKLGLSQDLMICIALLSGSDYTSGIHGIGPVHAMEILAEFSDPEVEQSHFEVLQTFKIWYDKWSSSATEYSGSPDKKKFLRFKFDSNFPDPRIIEAYYNPIVDESLDPFIWSKPSIDKLLEFIQSKLGWEKLKVLEMLDIVIHKKNTSTKFNHKNISEYFSNSEVEQLMNSKVSPSKRLRLATKQRNWIVKNIRKFNK